jgi:hypothetical protein
MTAGIRAFEFLCVANLAPFIGKSNPNPSFKIQGPFGLQSAVKGAILEDCTFVSKGPRWGAIGLIKRVKHRKIAELTVDPETAVLTKRNVW